MDFREDLNEIIETGNTDELKFKIFDLTEETDTKKINEVLVQHRMSDYPVAIWMDKNDLSFDFIKRHSYSYIEEDDIYLAYHNVDLPKCEGCLGTDFVPEKKEEKIISNDEGIVEEKPE